LMHKLLKSHMCRKHVALAFIAAFITYTFLQASVRSAPDESWKLDVTGFGLTTSWNLPADGEGRAYIFVDDMIKALRLGSEVTDAGMLLGWGGRQSMLKQGSTDFGGRTLTGPILLLDGKLSFPLLDVDIFGVKLTTDRKAKTATIAVPRASLKSFGVSKAPGPTILLIQLTHAPQSIVSFILTSPDRLVIDLAETTVDPAQSMDVTAPEATRIRASMNKPGVARVVLELTRQGAGAYVYQDPSDLSLIKVSYPGTVKAVAFSERGGLTGYLINSTKQMTALKTTTDGIRARVLIPDHIPDKTIKPKGEGYAINPSPYPWTDMELDIGGRSLGIPIIDGTSAFLPLLNRMTEARAVVRGSLALEIDFAEAIGLPALMDDDGAITMKIPGMSAALPLGISSLAEKGVRLDAADDGNNGIKLRITGLDYKEASLSLENEGRRLVLSSGGRVESLSVFDDNGVKRLTFGFSDPAQKPILVPQDDGCYLMEFPGIRTVGEKAAKTDLGQTGSIGWVETNEGVKCVLRLASGLVALQRQSASEGSVIIDVGYKILGYRLESENGTSRITIEASGPMKAQVFRLREPDRIVVDMPGFVEGPQSSEDVAVGGIRKVRRGQNTIGVARIVFDLEKYIGHTWEPTLAGSGLEIVLAEKLSGLFGRLILLDPGHGGKDGGAVGNSIIEKLVNLDIALKLRGMLEEQGAVVVMTRSADVKVELLERSGMANLLLPDAIICIHSNSVISPTPNGTETFYFNNEELSRELASAVHKSLVDRIGLANRGLFKKEYHMIKETYSPSVLIEVGFLSNVNDASMLADDAFRTKAAVGIFDGLVSYFSGTAQEKWALMKEGLTQSSIVPHYAEPSSAWPGLYLQRPWAEEAVKPPDPSAVSEGPGSMK